MSSRKRTHHDSRWGDPPDDDSLLRIVIAPEREGGATEELEANIHIIRSCCSCGEGLPKDATVWDLSTLDICGKPAQRDTVVAWLNCAYNRIWDSDFEPQVLDQRRTVAGLTKLLAFADAVGSRSGILAACISQIQGLKLALDIPEDEDYPADTLVLHVDGEAYYIDDRQDCLRWCTPVGRGKLFTPALGGRTRTEGILQQVTDQTEALLYEALRLQLEPLTKRMLAFIVSCTHRREGIFYGRLEDVFTSRVLGAALPADSTTEAQDAWINSVLTMPCSLMASGSYDSWDNGLFEAYSDGPSRAVEEGYLPPYGGCGIPPQYGIAGSYVSSAPHDSPIKFTAALKHHFMGAAAGERVVVEVDLFGIDGHHPHICIGEVKLPLQLLLGHPINSDEDRRELMRGNGGRH